jgi:uncharacterized membrane protein
MDIKRVFRHLLMTHWQVNAAFPAAVKDAISQAIISSRNAHVGQVSFAVEGALHVRPLFKGQTPQQRALEVFSHLRIWDTEYNNGLLIYLLLADRAVEIVVDRGLYSRADPTQWSRICRQMQDSFKQKNYEAGVIAGIQAVTQQLIRHFPVSAA